jgi:VRR-NUC domain
MTQPESNLVRKIRAYLEGRNAWVFKVHGGDNPFQEVGVPDLVCCWRGLFIGLEVKLPGEKASPKQRHVMKAIREAGGMAEVVTSVADVVKVLERTSRK